METATTAATVPVQTGVDLVAPVCHDLEQDFPGEGA
jgi:hypothetical protein